MGLVGVAAGALLVWVARPAPATQAAAEQLAVLRRIEERLGGVEQALQARPGLTAPAAGRLAPAAPNPPATPGTPGPVEPQLGPVLGDLQLAVAELAAASARLQAAASAGIVAEGVASTPADAAAVAALLDSLPHEHRHVPAGLFGLSPAAVYARFGSPSHVRTEGPEAWWTYQTPDDPGRGLRLIFVDGYLAGAMALKYY
jgi:hypothetical protein